MNVLYVRYYTIYVQHNPSLNLDIRRDTVKYEVPCEVMERPFHILYRYIHGEVAFMISSVPGRSVYRYHKARADLYSIGIKTVAYVPAFPSGDAYIITIIILHEFREDYRIQEPVTGGCGNLPGIHE